MTYEELKQDIELAEGIDEIASLRDYLETEYEGECRMELSRMLTAKENW